MENSTKKTNILGNIGGIVSAGAQVAQMLGIGQGAQDRRQIKQQGKLNDVNYEDAKRRADYEQELAMKMWKDTNYKAQLEEADKAGVSRSAVLGNSNGGATGASVSGGANAQASDSASTQNASINQMMAQAQLGMMIAQTKNINADTENKQASAGNLGEGTKGIAIENRGKEVDVSNKEAIKEELRDAMLGLSKEQTVKGIVADQTQKEQIKIKKQEAIHSVLENALERGKIKLTKAQIGEISEKLSQGWKALEFQGTDKITGKYLEELANAVKDWIK